MDNLFGSICLSDIPKELINTGKNGKKYLSVIVDKRITPSAYGSTHYIKAYVRKGTQLPEGTNLYIGDLKGSASPSASAQPQERVAPQPTTFGAQETDNLPF